MAAVVNLTFFSLKKYSLIGLDLHFLWGQLEIIFFEQYFNITPMQVGFLH